MLLLYTNADTITNKMRELELVANDMQADIIMITEILPKFTREDISDQYFHLEGYTLYTNLGKGADRGVAVYMREHRVMCAT